MARQYEDKYEIYSENEIVRDCYGDNVKRIKKVYKNRNGYYIKGMPYFEPASVYLQDFETRLNEWKKNRGV